MTTRYFSVFRSLFSAGPVKKCGTLASYRWIGNDAEAIFGDPQSPRIVAYIWHDGYGKFYPIMYLSIVQAIRHVTRHSVISFNLRSFPYVAIEMFRLKYSSIYEAMEDLEEYIKQQNIT